MRDCEVAADPDVLACTAAKTLIPSLRAALAMRRSTHCRIEGNLLRITNSSPLEAAASCQLDMESDAHLWQMLLFTLAAPVSRTQHLTIGVAVPYSSCTVSTQSKR